MQIRQVILKNVRNFTDFERKFEDSWSGRILESLLLIGPNGSGKTTLLTIIAELWQFLPDNLIAGDPPTIPADIFNSVAMAAIEIVGLESEPVWIIGTGADKKIYQEFVATQVNSHKIVGIYTDEDLVPSLTSWYIPPGSAELVTDNPPTEWEQHWTQRLIENFLGKRHDLPNMVYLESERRQLLPAEEKFSVQPEPDEFRWLARYEPTISRKGSLQNYLYNLKVIDEGAFQRIVDETNAFLIGKKLNGFNRQGELMVQVDGRGQHPITELSSGEKQVLLMLATITRWLRPGGIVLIDEPDLHLHISLTTAFVRHLRRMIADRGGQLIIASHEPELWKEFTPSHQVNLGNISELAR